MCWTKNKLTLTAGILIFVSLLILTILDQTIYANIGFKIAAVLQFVGISLMLYNMFIRKRIAFRNWRDKKKNLK